MTAKRSSAARYSAVAVAMLPVVRKVVVDKQLRDDFRHVVKSRQCFSGHTQGEGAGKQAQLRMTDPGSAELDSFMDALEDAANRIHHAIAREPEPQPWGRWLLLLGGVVVAGTAYLCVRRSDVRDRVVSMLGSVGGDTETIAT